MWRLLVLIMIVAGLTLGSCAPAYRYQPLTLTSLDLGQSRTLIIQSTGSWRNTGIEMHRGEVYRASTQGTWSAGPFCGTVTAAGLAVEHLACMKSIFAQSFPLPEGEIGALVGKIGANGKVFRIGSTEGFIADSDGTLLMRMNDPDDFLGDNSGQIEVAVQRYGESVDAISFRAGRDGRAEKRISVTRSRPAPAPRVAAVPQAPAKPVKKLDRFAGIHFGNYHALVIGNNRYKGFPDLKTAVPDARAVAETLRRDYGFRVDLRINAKRYDIISGLAKMRAKLTVNDHLLIYYAGHGVIDDVTEQGYWLPVDAEEGNPTNWISTSDVTTMMTGMRAKHVMVVADSCYSGTLVRSVSGRIKTGRQRVAWVRRMLGKRARTALVSGGLEPVRDSGGAGGHSVFARAFLDALEENRGVMEGQALFDAIKRPVALNSDQTPQYSDIRKAGHGGGDFLFVRK